MPTAYEISDDPARVDRDVVWNFLSSQAYWGQWRTRDDVESQLNSAWRVVGAYRTDGAMVGVARAMSDGISLAYLADVFVVEGARGNGLGGRIVEAMLAPPGDQMRWMLHTADAHGLYRKFGFSEPDAAFLERPRPA